MITEQQFAEAEARLGKSVHLHDGVWWIRTSPLYWKPVNEFRRLTAMAERPDFRKGVLGYSHQVEEGGHTSRIVNWNMIEGDDLRDFRIEKLKPQRRSKVRRGLRECRVARYELTEELLQQMQQINISQAEKMQNIRETGSFLPAEYYRTHSEIWRSKMIGLFNHPGHHFIGAFLGDRLGAYVDLVEIEDTWLFGAVKSHVESLKHCPVDALYFTILEMASSEPECSRVINGGGDEPPSLSSFKAAYCLRRVPVPYFTRTVVPLDKLATLRRRLLSRNA